MATQLGPDTVRPADLADRLADGEALTLLDVRPDADWTITAPSATSRHLPAKSALADPDDAARALDGPVTVVCDRGVSARPVMEALRERGVDAAVLEGGMRGWIGTLQDRRVPLADDRLEVWQIQRPGRGCLSYLIAAGGEALVVDPAPDAEHYTALAERLAVRITEVFDTHLHADHLSGARSLADATGASLRLPQGALDRGVAYAERVSAVRDGDTIALGGGIALDVLGLPGHTTDMTGLVIPGLAVVAGDSLFADGLARPDLERGDAEGSRAMARELHRTLHERVLALGDGITLLPCHTPPRILAEALAPTLGEARAAISELAIEDPDEFADALLAAMPPRPANYEDVIAVNAGAKDFDPDLETGGNSCATR